MNRRYVILSGLCVLAAVAAGCTPLRGTVPDAPVPPPLGKPRPANVDPPGGVVPAGGVQPGDTVGTGKFDISGQTVNNQSAPVGHPLAVPRPALPAPGGPTALPQAAPGVTYGPPVASYPTAGYPVSADPHTLLKPTASGKILDLGPNEMPTDRVLELARHLELILAQNRDLGARIKELEQLGARREQALIEAIREVEAAENEVAKTRGIILTQKSELASLQEKIKQLEREDIDTLRLVIAALEKLLPAPRREP